ncbi:unnamed protein product [Prorocentrum cordatum]|uniref:Uncharacterized protein n=2 Tax=Prorocentrum cordatum TaxID=2364126 RepID=A0ABN9S3A0_9DINO|nr:unnamed protein product [Polarella glacialis]CAK0852218.1 unnamed protein product [Polarella glacialis]
MGPPMPRNSDISLAVHFFFPRREGWSSDQWWPPSGTAPTALRTGAGSACRGDVAEKIGRPEGAKLPSRPRAEVPVEKVGSVARAELCARYRETNSTRRGEAAAEISCRAVLSAGPPAGVAAKVNEDGRQVPLEKRPLTWKVGD